MTGPEPDDPLSPVDAWPVTRAAVAVVDGVTGIAHHRGDPDEVFPLASVTKPVFAYAVLVAVEEGSLALDDAAGPAGSTIRHLLAHASGLGPDGGTPAAPGRRRIYSNAGFDVLARALADATGMAATVYVEEAVLEPLSMTSTTIDGSVAHAGRSSVNDLVRLVAEWLRPTLIDPTTMAAATAPQFPDLAGVLPGFGRHAPNPWGLGFEIRGDKHPHWTAPANSARTFGHFGRSGTFVWVDPPADTGLVALTDRPFGPWATTAWPELSRRVLADAERRRTAP